MKDGLNDIKGLVARIRDAVKYVRSSPQREQRFKSCVQKERINHKSSLCLDVQTRWNSTFLMLNTALKFQKAFERFENEDPHFCLELNDIPPTTKDWDDTRHFTSFLEKFYDATVHLSGSLYVISTMYFTEVCAIEGFLSECIKSLHPSLNVMAMKIKSKFDKYWGKIEKVNMLLIFVVLDPYCKLRYVSFCYSELYEASTVTELTKKVREALNQIYDEYQKLEFGMCSSSSQTCVEVDQPISGASKQLVSLKSKFQKHLAQEECDGGKSYANKYLEDACEKEGPNSHFEILNRWNVNSSRYKILSQVARDIFTIPVSNGGARNLI
ncbi:zinc finger BED domain-containing protein RICESLEEPER 1-like [Camellia sinensis]|uniref:zinc finger BED domain-containing protein RICESLEEPER 1-like n=1 Tax=Camellia sinensis TaxID=4442 RepID=UPI001036E48C|nr:zinc finger BED domain-containing protein RICESLEEPER 1-like [Camellia sinensis]